MRNWLNEQESIAKYGTPSYAGWKPADADADWRAKGSPSPQTQQPTTTPMTNTQRVIASTPQAQQPGSPQSVADLIAKGFGGYAGWGETEAIADFYATGGQGKYTAGTSTPSGTGTTGGGGATGISGFGVAPTIDLPAIYSGLYQNLGIQDTEAQINGLTQKYYEARAKISDNPFLSASMIDQRLQRLDAKYKEQTQPLLDAVAQKKADVETQMNLQIKQFDINSQQAKDALNYFNTLLEAGALDNASGTDIANITRATGISSAMIQSAISSKKKEKIDTQLVTSTADDGTVTASLINTQTGEVIKQSDLGRVGNQQTGDKTTATEAKEMIRQDIMNEAQAGATWDTIYQLAVIGGIDPRDAYNIYVSLGRYHPDTATQKKDLERYGISQTGYSNTPY